MFGLMKESKHLEEIEALKSSHEAEVTELSATIEELRGKLESQKKTIESVQIENDAVIKELRDAASKLEEILQTRNELISSVEFQDMAHYKAENEKLQQGIEDAKQIAETLQTQLSDVLHDHDIWGFPGKPAFPGSTVVTNVVESIIKDGTTNLVLRGRTIFDDKVSQQIGEKPTLNDQMSVALLAMKKQGVFDKILRDLITSGCIAYTIGVINDKYESSEEIDPETAELLKSVGYAMTESSKLSDNKIFEIYYQLRAEKPDAVFKAEVK